MPSSKADMTLLICDQCVQCYNHRHHRHHQDQTQKTHLTHDLNETQLLILIANLQIRQICKYVKLSSCLSATQSSNRAAKWLHVDSPTDRKWERYSIALCFCLFSPSHFSIGHFLLFLSVESPFTAFLLPKSSFLQPSRHSLSFHHPSVNGKINISAQLFILTLLTL